MAMLIVRVLQVMQRARMLLQVESRGAGARLCGRIAAGAGAKQLSYNASPVLCVTSTVLCAQGEGAGTRQLSSSSPPPLATSTVLGPEAKARCLQRMAKMKHLRPVTTPVRGGNSIEGFSRGRVGAPVLVPFFVLLVFMEAYKDSNVVNRFERLFLDQIFVVAAAAAAALRGFNCDEDYGGNGTTRLW